MEMAQDADSQAMSEKHGKKFTRNRRKNMTLDEAAANKIASGARGNILTHERGSKTSFMAEHDLDSKEVEVEALSPRAAREIGNRHRRSPK